MMPWFLPSSIAHGGSGPTHMSTLELTAVYSSNIILSSVRIARSNFLPKFERKTHVSAKNGIRDLSGKSISHHLDTEREIHPDATRRKTGSTHVPDKNFTSSALRARK